MIRLYDLVGAEDRRFSPNCWRTRLALAHKGLGVETKATKFTEIPSVCGSRFKTVPIIEDGAEALCDSWAIACYLEDRYLQAPSLFGGAAGRAMSLFFHHWVSTAVHMGIARMVILDIQNQLVPEDRDYFRTSREQRFGATLETVVADREERLPAFRQLLEPARATLTAQPFLGGEGPLYPDYLLFGALQWARVVSPFQILAKDDPVYAWFGRVADLHGGLGRSMKGYWD